MTGREREREREREETLLGNNVHDGGVQGAGLASRWHGHKALRYTLRRAVKFTLTIRIL